MQLLRITALFLGALTLLALFAGGIFVAWQINGAREAARLSSNIGRMHQVRMAVEDFKDHQNATFAAVSPDGATASWRIRLAPYFEERPLYDRYQFGEPWDSPANRSLLSSCPRAFRGETPTEFTRVLLIAPPASGSQLQPKSLPWWILTDEQHFKIPWTRPTDITEDELAEKYLRLVRSRKLKGTENVVIYVPQANPEIKALTIRELLVALGREAELNP